MAKSWVDDTLFIIADFGDKDSREHVSRKLELIKEFCKEIGIKAKSAKDFKGGGQIIKKIKKAIADSEFILCDISEPRGHSNANVYYEYGLAHGYENGKHDLLTICDDDTFSRRNPEYNLPFDIQAEHVHKFNTDESLKEVLQTNLKYMKNKRKTR